MSRHLIPALAIVAFATLALLSATDRPAYTAILNAIHVHPTARPFLDTRFVTAQVECWHRGIDVYARNPCDPLGRTLDYSPLWLRLPFLARADSWTPVFGLATDLIFLLALSRLPWAPRGPFALAVAIAAVFSWSTIFAMERGNTDLLIFAAAVLFAHLATRSTPARTAGYALVLAAGLLKFYPLTMLALAAREPRARAWTLAAIGTLALATFLAAFHTELARIGANMASSPFGDMFGARSLPDGVPLLLTHAKIRDPAGLYLATDALDPALRPLAWMLFAVMTAACALAALRHGRDPALAAALARIDPNARSLLLAGAVLCTGCFFGHQNIGYRAVLLLLVLPGLLALIRAASSGRIRALHRTTSLLVVLVLWDGIISRSVAGWFVMELAWWWIVFALLGVAASLLLPDLQRLRGGRKRPEAPA